MVKFTKRELGCKMKLYIADKDPFYVLDLKEAFLKHVEGITCIGVVSNINSLSDMDQSELEKYDVLLINEDILGREMVAIPVLSYSDNESNQGLNRFSSVAEFNDAIQVLLKAKYKEDRVEDLTELVVFTSLSENVGVTAVALSSAEILKEKGKILYLQFAQFGDQFLYFPSDKGTALSNVLYEYNNERSCKIQRAVEQAVFDNERGIYHYGDVSNYFDLQILNNDLLIKFVLSLKETGVYRYIVMDLKLTLGQVSFSLISHSDKTVFICDHNEFNCIKTNKFHEDLKWIELYHELNVLGKSELWLNRFRIERNISAVNWENWKCVKKVPYVKDLVFMQRGKYYIKNDTVFYKSIEVNLDNWHV